MKKLIQSILLIVSIILVTGCSLTNPTTPQKPKIDPNLPVVESSTIRFIPDIESIALEWKGSGRADVDGYYIYRSDIQENGAKLTRVATIDDKYTKHYLDKELKPETSYFYAISIKGNNDQESQISQSIETKTLPVLDSVSLLFATSELPRKVRLEWRPHESFAIEKYIIERNSATSSEWKKVATVKNRLNAEYIDKDLDDKTTYTYRIKSVTFNGITSKPSQSVTATTKALPNAISNLMATNDQPRKIVLAWDHSDQSDIVSYNVYFSSSPDGSFSLLKTIPVSANRIEHLINEDGKSYFYKVTTIDKDKLETDIKMLPTVMGMTLSAPVQPTITLALIKDNTVILNWTQGDNRAKYYNIYKTIKTGFFTSETKVIKNVEGVRYEDADIVRGVDYKYEIEAVDQHNLVSPKTKSTTLAMPTQVK